MSQQCLRCTKSSKFYPLDRFVFFCVRFVAHLQCLTVQLYEHQLQDTQWMFDQEMLEGGSRRHLWAELPAHPNAPSVRMCKLAGITRERNTALIAQPAY